MLDMTLMVLRDAGSFYISICLVAHMYMPYTNYYNL